MFTDHCFIHIALINAVPCRAVQNQIIRKKLRVLHGVLLSMSCKARKCMRSSIIQNLPFHNSNIPASAQQLLKSDHYWIPVASKSSLFNTGRSAIIQWWRLEISWPSNNANYHRHLTVSFYQNHAMVVFQWSQSMSHELFSLQGPFLAIAAIALKIYVLLSLELPVTPWYSNCIVSNAMENEKQMHV